MPPSNDQQPRPGKVRAGLRILAWIIPGLSAPAFLLGFFALTYGTAGRVGEWIFLPVAAGFLALILACGFLDAKLTPRPVPEDSPKAITREVLIFFLLQVLLVPALGIGVITGCTAIVRSGI